MHQMQAREGIKQFGEEAIAALIKKFKHLDQGAIPGKSVICLVDPITLTTEEKRQALNAINLIKQKRDGSLKGRTCADGRRQRPFLTEDSRVLSPTCNLDGLFATFLIDAKEQRHIATFDVPGAFLQPEQPKRNDRLLLRLTGIFVDIMVRVNPEYDKTIIYEKGVKVLYMHVLRSIYGTIEAAMLWYDFYVSKLKIIGFTLNEYDPCVANMMIEGAQCTVVWHVDDNKV